MIKKKRRKNPEKEIIEFLEDLKPYEDNIQIEFIGKGSFGETYTFEILYPKVLDNGQILYSGKYLLKRFINRPCKNEISHIMILSKYGLIPKIYYMNKNYVIMKYIKSVTLHSLIKNQYLSISETKLIFNQIRKLIGKWHDLGFYHGDLDNLSNMLITENEKVYLIDPGFDFDHDFREKNEAIETDLETISDLEKFSIASLRNKR